MTEPDLRWHDQAFVQPFWHLDPTDQRVANEVGREWRTANLWALPRSDDAVREAVAFAYMMADLPPPSTIVSADGPLDGELRASDLGAAFLWPDSLGIRRFGSRIDEWDLQMKLEGTRRFSWQLAHGTARAFRRVAGRGGDIVDWIHERVHRGAGVCQSFERRLMLGALADFLCRTSLLPDAGDLEGLHRLFFACGPFWWAGPSAFVYCRAPTTLHLDGTGAPHAGEGPALAWADGTEVWAWRGLRLDERWVKGRHKLSIEEVLREPNVELRRALIELYGLERWTRELGTAVAEDASGKLWRIRIHTQEVCFVEVVNSTPEPDGTRKTYFLRVPSWMRSPRQAVAWTFGLSESEYEPAIET